MIIIKEGTKERIKNWHDNNIHILTDFDRTITRGDSNSSWGILSKNNFNKEYEKERKSLYEFYRPIEINEKIDLETKDKLMEEWWNKHISLFVKYKMSEDIINNALNNNDIMSFRNGAKEFLVSMHKRKIPVIIISAGIGNFIEQFLIKHNCYYDNIYIVSNFIKFENGVAVGISGNLIHSFNKNEVSITDDIKEVINGRNNIILLGDTIGDIFMARKEDRDNALKIGFLEENIEENLTYFENSFDVVCTDNTSYNELFTKLEIKKND